jgi:methyl-accepting chemotaxis protein
MRLSTRLATIPKPLSEFSGAGGFGTTKMNNDVVDAVAKDHGAAAMLFVKSEDKYVRVATTLKKEDGSSAVGTSLDATSPAVAKINKGESSYVDATIFGKSYVTGYEPINDASGVVIGAHFVGQQK